MNSKFIFFQDFYPKLYDFASLAEGLYHVDASSSISKSRLLGEKLIQIIAAFEKVDLFDKNQNLAISHLKNLNILPELVADIFHVVRKSGNVASHQGVNTKEEALFILKKIYSLSVWFYETYENDFIEDKNYQLPVKIDDKEIDSLKKKVEQLSLKLQDYQSKIEDFNDSKDTIEKRRKLAQEKASKIEWNELETRINLIDDQLRLAGWECNTVNINYKSHKSLPEKGKNKAIAEWPCDKKYADYALFVGLELYGLVEAKRFGKDISTDIGQSKIYSGKILETDHVKLLGNWNDYQVPFLFSTNGRAYFEQLKTKSGIWFQDIRRETNRAYPLRGWFSPESLKEIFERNIDEANEKLEQSDYDYLTSASGLNLYPFQINAIKAVEEKLVTNNEDLRALIVMATGTGKTRTINGLIYRLIKANRFKRVLFLTDRRLLATQARDSIKENKVEALQSFGGIYKFDDLHTTRPDSETRLQFATVQSMVKRLFFTEQAPLTVDTYDCIIVDEAHRGYNLDKELDEDDIDLRNEQEYMAQYRKVLDYFDAYKIGMTATPAIHTKEIFGTPTFEYSYRQAVIDGYLVDYEPPYNIKTKLGEEGIIWDKGEKPTAYNPETGEIIDLSELEDELKFDIEHFNKQVVSENFNRVVVKELVKHLDPEGEGKTLIFTARDTHADMIVNLLKEEFENIGIDLHDKAIQKITGSVYDNEQLTRDFKNERYPNIVVTVDLLTTGIDVPKISNLVFLRRVRSRILYEQMLGRATRLCPEIGKEVFKIFDAVRLYEAMEDFTTMKPVSSPSFSFKQLFEEVDEIDSTERLEKQKEQIIAKLNRKVKKMTGDLKEKFAFQSGNVSVEDFMKRLKESKGDDIREFIKEHANVWNFLDEKIYQYKPQFISNHLDQVMEVSRGYGKMEKPEDYIESFRKFLDENKNKLNAISIICNKPQELDRKSLKELKLLLDDQGFTESHLNTAWKSLKNTDIAADIIAYIRTLSLGTELISADERIKKAIIKIKQKRQWNATQTKWIERFERQLVAETILTQNDLDLSPFLDEGGFKRLDKIFNNELGAIIEELNLNLYTA